MTRPLIMLFGGQSSRDDAMLERLCAADSTIGKRTAQRAGGSIRLTSNRDIQVSVMAVTLGWLEIAHSMGLRATESAGLSLGEYAHLVEIGCLDGDAALELVARRGALYDEGPRGCMAAIQPLPWLELASVVKGSGCEPAVFGAPTQTVLAGERSEMEALLNRVERELFAVVTVIEDQIPMHVSRFRPVADELRRVLDDVDLRAGSRAYWPNVAGERSSAEPQSIREMLVRHVYQPVQWVRTVASMLERHPEAVFLEVGPRSVLSDLLRRRWVDRPVFAIDPMTVEEAPARVRDTVEAVRDAL